MDALPLLEQLLRRYGRVVVGYSGGVDSALLAVVAHRVLGAGDMVAVLGLSPAVPEVQTTQAREVAAQFGFPLRSLPTDELDDPGYASNPENRCYFCKRTLWRHLDRVREEGDYAFVLDGTHAGDLVPGEHRPGAQAGQEAGVQSPLADLGWTKEMVRTEARRLGLPIWDAPAAPCLASRVQYGLPVTVERLRQVERAEAFLRDRVGIAGDLRVRHLGLSARIEVTPREFDLVDASWSRIMEVFGGLGFGTVIRDPDGYRRGSLLPVLDRVG